MSQAQPDDATTLHLRCGSDIEPTLREAGFVGGFLEFADPFCHGPVQALPRPAFLRSRKDFIADAYRLDPEAVAAKQAQAYAALNDLSAYDRAVLWFEHDAYDQTVLAFLLAQYRDTTPPIPFELICIADHPGPLAGVGRFIGLGQLSPAQLRALWETNRVPVTPEHLALGTRFWDMFRDPDPASLAALANRPSPPITQMAPAFRRMLQELPDSRTGLGLTQKLTLEIARDLGPVPAGKMFGPLMHEREPLPYLGDLMFWHEIEDLLAASPSPLTEVGTDDTSPWPKRTFELSNTGHGILNGEIDYMSLSPPERWIGGLRISPGEPCPRWNPATGTILTG